MQECGPGFEAFPGIGGGYDGIEPVPVPDDLFLLDGRSLLSAVFSETRFTYHNTAGTGLVSCFPRKFWGTGMFFQNAP